MDDRRRELMVALRPHGLRDIVGETTVLQRDDGDTDRYRGSCPWHPGTGMGLYVSSAGWHCFDCGAGGDAVQWIVRRDGVGAEEAITTVEVYLRASGHR